MCILAFAKNIVPEYPLILIGNRDEFYQRPTREAGWWENGLLAGRDLEAGGTWLGINRNGRFSTLTNYRDISRIKPSAKSRGILPVEFLTGKSSPSEFSDQLKLQADHYNGFNLLTWEKGEMVHFSNYENKVNQVADGIHVLSNALLNTPWFKTEKLRREFTYCISQHALDSEAFFKLLIDETKSPEDMLPNTGLSPEKEKQISSVCIRTPDYGTCCSTIVMINQLDEVVFIERIYPVGNRKAATNAFRFKFAS